jgi:hypothetical protein
MLKGNHLSEDHVEAISRGMKRRWRARKAVQQPRGQQFNGLPKIERNVPIPPPHGRGRPVRFPFAGMAVGDSFFVADTKSKEISNCVSNFVKHHGGNRKFTVRTVEGGARCWRVK